jgi:hypothetical protein
MQELGGPGGFHPDFKGKPGKPGSGFLWRAHEWAICKAVRMKLKVKWRSLNARDARNAKETNRR